MSEDQLRDALAAYTSEALQLRFAVALPAHDTGAQDILHSLLDVRVRLDRIEALLGHALRLRASTARARAHAQAVVEDAWDRAATDERESPVARGGEYTSARERHAFANLAVLDLRHSARASAEAAENCDAAVDLLRLTHRGLDGLRHDLIVILRTLTTAETPWER